MKNRAGPAIAANVGQDWPNGSRRRSGNRRVDVGNHCMMNGRIVASRRIVVRAIGRTDRTRVVDGDASTSRAATVDVVNMHRYAANACRSCQCSDAGSAVAGMLQAVPKPAAAKSAERRCTENATAEPAAGERIERQLSNAAAITPAGKQSPPRSDWPVASTIARMQLGVGRHQFRALTRAAGETS